MKILAPGIRKFDFSSSEFCMPDIRPALHFDVLHLVVLRERETIEEALTTENEGEMLIRTPAHVHSAHAALRC